MIRILTDWHHHSLAESLLILFEDRGILGETEVWFPAGMEWFERDHWVFEKAWHGDAVARQYLLGIWDSAQRFSDGTLLRTDPRHPGRMHKGITLDAALGLSWDLVISSLPHNDAGMHAFAQQVGARFVVQVGNNHQESRWDLADAILSSSTLPHQGLVDPSTWARPVTAYGRPAVIYHQEFSLDTFRHEYPPEDRGRIANWTNCFPETPPYEGFRAFARAHAADFDFRVYGSYGSAPPDELAAGDVSLVPEVADRMRACGVIFHAKHWSDGFGHVIHNAFAIGRPVVGIERYYRDKLAGPLFVEGATSFDIETRSEDELVAVLARLRDDADFHQKVSEDAAARFREVVDFDADAEAVQTLLAAVLM